MTNRRWIPWLAFLVVVTWYGLHVFEGVRLMERGLHYAVQWRQGQGAATDDSSNWMIDSLAWAPYERDTVLLFDSVPGPGYEAFEAPALQPSVRNITREEIREMLDKVGVYDFQDTADSDGDGLPDYWEDSSNINPDDDPDGDGWYATEEYLMDEGPPSGAAEEDQLRNALYRNVFFRWPPFYPDLARR